MTETKQSCRVVAKQPLLEAVMDELAGSAHISFEGDLTKTRLSEIDGSSDSETDALRRNTIWPKQDFVVVPLEQGDRSRIKSAFGGTIPRSVLHIQIEKNGTLQFGMYDNGAGAFLGSGLSEDFLHRLEAQGAIARNG